jgi:hypothetical protein
MLPLVELLFSKGLSLLGNAVLAKGQDVIEEKLGIDLNPNKTPPEVLRKLEIEHEQFLIEAGIQKQKLDIEAEHVAQSNVTERWKADMLADSWLSKNIRPMVLVSLLATYFLFAILSAFDIAVTQSYVELLAQMIMLVMGAYFAGRTVEKIVDMRERGKM